jgi:CTP-dependent riboflavin kinase
MVSAVEILRGVVTSGMGDLARWMVRFADLYEERTGTRPYPGSLNIVLTEDWRLPPGPIRLAPSEYGGRVGMNLVPCRLSGVACFIVRTDDNEAGTGHYDRKVVEIAAAVQLREALDLSDGDEVEIEID